MRRPINYSLLILPFILFSCSIWIEDEKPFDGEIDIPFSSSTTADLFFSVMPARDSLFTMLPNIFHIIQDYKGNINC